MKSKYIKLIDIVLIFGTIIFLASFVSYARPLVISPINNLETTNQSVLFNFERGNIILIDDNLEFSSPQKIYAENNLIINLKPGKYYWKIEGMIGSEIRDLTILSEINLRLKQVGDLYEITNAGNVDLNVGIYENENLVDNLILNVDESQEISGEKFIGEPEGGNF
jgi:hypothetical protein